MALNGSKQIGAISVASYLTRPAWSRNPSITHLGKAIFGSISQTVKLRLTHTQGHSVNQWQSWGGTQSSDAQLPCFTARCNQQASSGRRYLLSPCGECLRSPAVAGSCFCLGCLVSSWCCPVLGRQLSPAPCPLLPHPEPRAEYTEQGKHESGWGPPLQ